MLNKMMKNSKIIDTRQLLLTLGQKMKLMC